MDDELANELQNLFAQFNHQNYERFQSFEQSYQQWTLVGANTAESEAAIINTIIETSQSFQQNFQVLCVEISNFAEKVSGLTQVSEHWKEEYVSLLEGQYTIFQNFQLVWNLLEIFQINTFSKFTIFDLLPSLQVTRFVPTDYYRAFTAMTHPERYDPSLSGREEMTDETTGLTSTLPFGYWEVVYDSVLQGNLTTALEFLKLHSEIRDYYFTTSSATARSHAVSSRVRRFVSKEEVQRLFQLLESYPYRHCLQRLFPSPLRELLSLSSTEEGKEPRVFTSYYDREMYFHQYFSHPGRAMELSKWQEGIEQFRETAHLLTQIPELDFLLRLLQGESQALELQAKGSWQLHLLGRCLYQYPCHQLTKINLRRLMVEVLDCYYPHHTNNNNNREESHKPTSLLILAPEGMGVVYTEILKGNVGWLMKVLYETASAASANTNIASHRMASAFSVSVLLSVVHLCRLLIIGGNLLELSTPLAQSLHQVSFLEEVVLEAAEKLAQLHYPPEMLKGYLSLSPQYGSLFYRQLLLHRPIQSDTDCVEVATALAEIGFVADSLQVYRHRGRYWLHYPKNYRRLREDIATNASLCGVKATDATSTLPQAATHYLRGQDVATVSLLLESSLYRCMAAVVDCSDVYFLEMLHYQPGKPVLPQRPGRLIIDSSDREAISARAAQSTSLVVSDPSVMNVDELEELHQKEGEAAVVLSEERRSHYLDYALREAEGLLQALDVQALTTTLSSSSSSASSSRLVSQYETLKSYVVAITALLTPRASPPNASYREAATTIAQLLVPEVNSVQVPAVSNRYWLHLLELAYFIHHLITSLELKQSLDQDFLSQFDVSRTTSSETKKASTATPEEKLAATLDQTMMTIVAEDTTKKDDKVDQSAIMTHFGQPVYSKAIVQQFHVIYLLLEQLPDFPFLILLCSPKRGKEQQAERDRELRDQLKMNLLSLLTSTYLVSSHAYFSDLAATQSTSGDIGNLVFSSRRPAVAQSLVDPDTSNSNRLGSDQAVTWQLQQVLPSHSSIHNKDGQGDEMIMMTMTMDYGVEDLLDGSVFFASL